MGQGIHRLTVKQVQSLGPGRHSDGGGLYLQVKESGAKSWILRYQLNGVRRDLGLGSALRVPLAGARQMAAQAREDIGRGIDPLQSKQAQRVVIMAARQSFGEYADLYFEKSVLPTLTNDKTVYQWRETYATFCASIRGKQIQLIETSDVLAVLNPIWHTIPETARRVRSRIERVLDAATVEGVRPATPNPARWKGHLDKLLPKSQKLTRGHHPSLPYPDIPAFMASLRNRHAPAAMALQFVILTCSRAGEALGARWDEFDFEAKTWTVPASRMKMKKAHRVPLSEPALAILADMKILNSIKPNALVFPSMRGLKQSPATFARLLERMKRNDITTHGFRSSFRDWAGDTTDAAREVAEACLAHMIGNDAERAYRRSDALEKRRALLEQWGAFCSTKLSTTAS